MNHFSSCFFNKKVAYVSIQSLWLLLLSKPLYSNLLGEKRPCFLNFISSLGLRPRTPRAVVIDLLFIAQYFFPWYMELHSYHLLKSCYLPATFLDAFCLGYHLILTTTLYSTIYFSLLHMWKSRPRIFKQCA